MLALIIVIAAIAIWMDLPNNPGIHIAGIDRDIETRLGLDLVGGVQALLEADLPEGTEIDAESMRTATRIVENRVNGLGVTEAVVQQAGDRRIVVELPGETDPEKALETIKQTGLLEFVEMDYSPLPDGMIIKTDFAVGEQADLTDEEVSTEETIYHTVMTGAVIKNVGVTTGPAGGYEVAFELTDEGTRLFADYTTNNAGKFLGIVLDKEVVSAPRIDEPITEGAGVIRGDFSLEGANALAIQLRYGSLPIPLKIVESRTVGPTLGQDSLSQSLLAGMIGVTIMALFMALYYRIPGVIADVSILIYALIAFALFRFVPVTLTLPGIAGLMLSTGSALDANILIFERMKEELRNGRRLSQAIDIAWQRAWPSIRDSNIATLITCAILFWFGSSFGATLVKGFSLTLALGVAVSLFAAIVVTRTLLNLILGYFKPTNFERWFGI
jgi:preprotein translocase subunit SecD